MSFSTFKVNLFLIGLLTIWHLTSAITPNDHPCYRTCLVGQVRKCEYYFTLEHSYTLGANCNDCPLNPADCNLPGCIPADGTQRSVMVTNGKFPGPSIEVCLGDIIVVHVTNGFISDATTLHWHGQHQRWTPYMDGVGFVTQCPILPGNTFTYRYWATEKGTHLWHSHTGLQRGEGLVGALVVREPTVSDPHAALYDYDLSEHVLIIQDWTHVNDLDKYLEFTYSDGNNIPDNILVNGKGWHQEFENQTVYTPIERFVVDKGSRYRFRIINNGILNCPIELSVDDHSLTLISSDSRDLLPTIAESVVSSSGERYDVIINANQEEGVYWIRLKGLKHCQEPGIHQVAVLQYSGASDNDYPDEPISYELAHKDGLQINSVNIGLETTNNLTLSVAHLESVDALENKLKGTPDFKFIATLRLIPYGAQINNISMRFHSSAVLPDRTSSDFYCNKTTTANGNCGAELCRCVHVERIPLNSLVEMIFVDTERAALHPMHLHGFSFRVIGMEYLGGTVNEARIKYLDQQGLLRRNFVSPPLKDVIMVPGPGYTIIRFIAHNPGYWLLHCHLEFHTAEGMSLLLKVGEDSDMVPVPANFPKCGNYDINYP